ncbi:FlgN protein [Paenibacillus sp. 1_12]|uniref:flagellar protein FlgN n=1 Tax=Paenibacillus sp. 1_12 TaxID=1566278 RepID=UPI0008E2F807|nr:flagellar protein FlgN [Paenibacillus sp. 1_12]SFL89025.1 FlgN protein [Paenibacillus sp. 1_12]
MAFEALVQTMQELNDIHDILFELAEQKKQVLVRNDVPQLMQLVSKETKLVKQVGELDQRRIDTIGQFLIEKGYKPNPKVTVSDLTKIIFNPAEKKMLLDLQKQLIDTIRNLRESNRLNQQLIEHSLAFIDYSLDLIAGPPEDGVFYQNPQQQQAPKRVGMFDTRA